MPGYRHILYATDFSAASFHALEWAAALARAFDARLRVVHVLTLHDADPARAKAELPREVPEGVRDLVESTRTVRAISAEVGILHEARKHGADLIVLGTHGRGGLKHVLLGSVAERVVQLASCPVLTVRPPEHRFEHPAP